jgi:predicted GH43/DUF377 family glycosyl hydrolase
MWRLSKTVWKEKLKLWFKSQISPDAQSVLDAYARVKSFEADLNRRAEAINDRIEEINGHLREFRRIQNKSNDSIEKILFQYEQDIPAFQDQVPWECEVFELPYGKDFRMLFNPSVIEVKGERWLIVRNCKIDPNKRPPYDSFSHLTRYRLDDTKVDYSSKVDIPLPLGSSRSEQWEDPRILQNGNRLLLTCCNFIQGQTYAHQAMAVLDLDWNLLGINHTRYGKNGHDLPSNTGHEKNWAWFIHEGELHMVYSMEPHVVVKCDSAASVVEEYSTKLENDIWFYGERRGGSNPIRIGDEYFAFFHSSTPWWHGRRRYYMGAYAFEAKPPFRITRSTTIPLLHGSKNNHRILEFPLVIFPGGSLYDEDKQEHFVVFGVNDFQSGWIKIPHSDLLALMKSYVQKKKDPYTATAKGSGRIHPIARVDQVTGTDFSDKEVVRDTGDDSYPGNPEKRNTQAVDTVALERQHGGAIKAGKS